MCSPTVAVMTLTAAAGAYGAYSQYQQGQYQADVAKNNAITQRRMAEHALARGERDEQRHRLKVAQAKSEQRAAFGASGRDISGSALDILSDTAMMGELDALTIRNNAELEAYGYEVGAQNSEEQADLYQMRGEQGAAGTLLTTGAKVGSQWYKYKPSGSGGSK